MLKTDYGVLQTISDYNEVFLKEAWDLLDFIDNSINYLKTRKDSNIYKIKEKYEKELCEIPSFEGEEGIEIENILDMEPMTFINLIIDRYDGLIRIVTEVKKFFKNWEGVAKKSNNLKRYDTLVRMHKYIEIINENLKNIKSCVFNYLKIKMFN